MQFLRFVDRFMALCSIVELVEISNDEMHCVIWENATPWIAHNLLQSAGEFFNKAPYVGVVGTVFLRETKRYIACNPSVEITGRLGKFSIILLPPCFNLKTMFSFALRLKNLKSRTRFFFKR